MPKQNTAASGFGDEVGGRISGFRRLPAPSGFIGACLYDSKSQKPGEEEDLAAPCSGEICRIVPSVRGRYFGSTSVQTGYGEVPFVNEMPL